MISLFTSWNRGEGMGRLKGRFLYVPCFPTAKVVFFF